MRDVVWVDDDLAEAALAWHARRPRLTRFWPVATSPLTGLEPATLDEIAALAASWSTGNTDRTPEPADRGPQPAPATSSRDRAVDHMPVPTPQSCRHPLARRQER